MVIVEQLAGETEVLGENRHSATLSTTNPIRPDLGSKAGRCFGKPATIRLSYGTALMMVNTFHEQFNERLRKVKQVKDLTGSKFVRWWVWFRFQSSWQGFLMNSLYS
jgi:hypothetical protein